VALADAIAESAARRKRQSAKDAAGRKPRQEGKPNCMPVDELTVADLERHPVWEYDVANEANHDETWVKPVDSLPLTDLSNRIVGTKAVLACKVPIPCILGNISLNDSRRTEQFLTVTILGDDNDAFDLARYHDADYNRNGPSGLARFLKRTVEDVFPILYDISSVASGAPNVVKGMIPLAPVEKLTQKELIRLAIEST
jgi:hypothetical protein